MLVRLSLLGVWISFTLFGQTSVFGPGASYPAQNMPIATVTADFNGDGKLDLAVANAASSSISVYLGKGDGTFSAAPTVTVPGNCAVTVIFPGDFTSDGKPDLLAGCSLSSTVWVLPGLGNGQFGTAISTNLNAILFDGFIGTEFTNLAIADFNGDGKLDFAVITAPTIDQSQPAINLQVFTGTGTGSFSLSNTIPLPAKVLPNVLVTADFNRDGHPDLAVAVTTLVKNTQQSQILFYQGTANGNFQQVSSLTFAGFLLAGAVSVADVNSDGKPDLVVAIANVVTGSITITSSTITSYLNNGNFSFTPSASETEADQVGGIQMADFLGTGKPGIVEELLDLTVEKNQPTITPLNQLGLMFRAGNGDGTFQAPAPIALPTGLAPLSIQVAVGDWNGDGLPDLAVAASPSSGAFGLGLANATGSLIISAILAAYDAMPAGNLVTLLNTETPPPAIKLSAGQLQFSGSAGGGNPPSQSVNISNSGGGTLAWTATTSANWLSVSPSSGSGNGSITVTVSSGNLSAGPYNGTITISAAGASNSPQTVSVTLALTAMSTLPQITAVVNGASFQPGIESGSWVTIEGTNLSNTSPGRTWTASEIVNGNLPTSLDQTSVTIDGKPAFVYYISPTQLNVQAPTDSVTGTVNVVVTNNGQVSAPFAAQLQTDSPAFFLYGNTAYAIGSHYPDYALIGNPSVVSGTIAAHPGDILILWATGFGPTSPATAAGIEVTGAPAAASTPVITVGGTPVQVLATVLTPGTAGLYQIAIQLPGSLPSGPQVLQASTGGVQSPSNVLLFIAGQ